MIDFVSKTSHDYFRQATILTVAYETIRKALWLHRSEWQKRALSSEDLNVEGVQHAVAQIYMSAGMPPPERLVWLDSPLSGSVAA